MTVADNGILVGVVESLEDSDGLGRVRVRLPTYDNQVTREARMATPFAGKNRGMFFKPEIGDEVLIAFERGDPRHPYILGALWSKEDPPPADDGRPEDNNWRFLTSRSGHVLRFDDTDGGEKIELIDKDGSRRLVIDTANGKVRIECDQGDVEITAQMKVKIEAQTVEVKASGDLKLEAGGQLTIKGSTVNIN
jgi:uncharacterized protein involved in type VI secretion and phage assembly